MATGIASGLGATWGVAQEATVGTFVAPTRWLPFHSDKMVGEKKTVQSPALHGGLYELAQRRRLVFHGAKGAVDLDVTDRQLGLLLKHMIGSNPSVAQQGGSTAYLQLHTPGDLEGLSLSLQSGRPEVSGTIQSFSYNGCKVTDWELSCAVDQLAKLVLTFDGWDESTSQTYTAPSYVADNVLAFVDGQLLLGGTVTTTNGYASVSGSPAAPIGVVSNASIKGANGLDVARQSIGSLTKREQLANAFRKYTGQIDVEFANLTDMYNAYYADTPLTLQLNFQGALIAAGYYAQLNVLCPSIRFNGAPPSTDGPAILKVTAPFDVLDDATDPVVQFSYQTADVTP